MMDIIFIIAGYLATPALVFSYVPQIISLYRTKNADGIALSFWYILNFSLSMLFIKAIEVYVMTGGVSMLIAQTFNLGLGLVVMFQVIYYKKRRRLKSERRPKL